MGKKAHCRRGDNVKMFDYDEQEQKMSKLCKGKSRKDIDEILGEKEKEIWQISQAELRLM